MDYKFSKAVVQPVVFPPISVERPEDFTHPRGSGMVGQRSTAGSGQVRLDKLGSTWASPYSVTHTTHTLSTHIPHNRLTHIPHT